MQGKRKKKEWKKSCENNFHLGSHPGELQAPAPRWPLCQAFFLLTWALLCGGGKWTKSPLGAFQPCDALFPSLSSWHRSEEHMEMLGVRSVPILEAPGSRGSTQTETQKTTPSGKLSSVPMCIHVNTQSKGGRGPGQADVPGEPLRRLTDTCDPGCVCPHKALSVPVPGLPHRPLGPLTKLYPGPSWALACLSPGSGQLSGTGDFYEARLPGECGKEKGRKEMEY